MVAVCYLATRVRVVRAAYADRTLQQPTLSQVELGTIKPLEVVQKIIDRLIGKRLFSVKKRYVGSEYR